MTLLEDTWDRIDEANLLAGWFGEWTVGERDQIDALAADLNRELQLYPVVHAWSTNGGRQLTFWCRYCSKHHFHGRPFGADSGNGHREAHCGPNPSSPYNEHGYILHEVEPNDIRATRKLEPIGRRGNKP